MTEVSARSPRTAWLKPRSVLDTVAILEKNGFREASLPGQRGLTLVRACGWLALRITIAAGRASLETALTGNLERLAWRMSAELAGCPPWRLAREVLEMLAALDIDTPIRWG